MVEAGIGFELIEFNLKVIMTSIFTFPFENFIFPWKVIKLYHFSNKSGQLLAEPSIRKLDYCVVI